VLGSFCVVDTRPRHWTDLDVTAIEKLAFSVMTEINLRSEISARTKTEEKLNAQNEKLKDVYKELKQMSKERLLAVEQLRQRELMLIKQSRLAAMGEMIGNIAHQWRQPLNMLALLAQDLKAVSKSADFSIGYLDETVSKTMEIIKHMSKTIDDFRNFFKPDTEKVNFQIVETIKKTIFLLSTSLAEAHIKTEIAVEQSPVVNGYPNDYSQAIINIIFNARDACVERKVRDPKIYIEISTDGKLSAVTITDNAGGIPEDILDKIFDPYFSTKGPNGGTGIGLYMSKVLIEKHMGGSLSVKNTDGGAQFLILV
jgi:signal transduction histidine kinase